MDLNNATAQYKLAVPWSTTPSFGARRTKMHSHFPMLCWQIAVAV